MAVMFPAVRHEHAQLDAGQSTQGFSLGKALGGALAGVGDQQDAHAASPWGIGNLPSVSPEKPTPVSQLMPAPGNAQQTRLESKRRRIMKVDRPFITATKEACWLKFTIFPNCVRCPPRSSRQR